MEDDDSESSKQIRKVFGDKTLYEILNISKPSDEEDKLSQEEIKHAYRKMALKYHPDKGGDAEQFKALSLAYSILSDPNKRQIYDESGDINGDDEGISNNDFEAWYSYYRNLFPKITVDDIEKFQSEYVGSLEERKDIISYYNRFMGDVRIMMNYIMFAEEGEDEERVCDVLNDAILKNELESLPKFEAFQISLLHSKKKKNKKASKRKSSKASSSVGNLSELILAKQTSRESAMIDGLINKYCKEEGEEESTSKKSKNNKKKKSEYEISDEDFEKLRNSISR